MNTERHTELVTCGIEYRDLGRMDYKICWELQQSLFDALLARKSTPDAEAGFLLLVEHPPVYTLGKSGHAENMLVSEEFLRSKGAAYYHIDRGGDITFHGDGQIVGYPILDLERLGIGLRAYIEALEEAVIRTVGAFGIEAGRLDGASGVWIGDGVRTEASERPTEETPSQSTGGGAPRKICAIGVRASRHVTMHGFALNVATDLRWFSYINPCGFVDRGVTSIEREVGHMVSLERVKALLAKNLSEILNVKIYNK